MFVTHYVPGGNKVQTDILASRARSQGRCRWCHLKGRHWWIMHTKYEVSISYGSKVIAKVKVDNRQTNKQTEIQKKNQTGRNNIPPIIRSRGIKRDFY